MLNRTSIISQIKVYFFAPRVQLFVTSFVLLYLELALIRFIPAYVRYLGYFTNFILLGSFLGIGVGCLFARSKRNLLPFFAPLLFLVVFLTKYFQIEVDITSNQAIFFKGAPGMFEFRNFSAGTRGILEAIAESKAFSVIAGGSSSDAIKKFGINKKKFGYVSLSGGALVKYLAGEKLPGLEALK